MPVGLVEDLELVAENSLGPGIGGDVVDDDEKDMVVGIELQERRPEQDVGGQVEGPVGLLPHAPVEFVGLADAGTVTEVEGGQVESRWLGNDLDVLVVDDAECRAQGGVAMDDGLEGAAEGIAVEGTAELPGLDDVVSGQIGFELVQEPEPALGKGHRRFGVEPGVTGGDGPESRFALSAAERGDACGQEGDGGEFEELAEGELHIEQ